MPTDRGLGLPQRLGRRKLAHTTLIAIFLMSLGDAAAGSLEAPDPATALVTALDDGLLAGMKAGRAAPFATRYGELAPLIQRAFDLPGILQAAVGLRWAALAAADRSQLLDAFYRYTVSSYVANFSSYRGENFVILPDRRRVGEQVVVPTQIVRPSGKPARLDYVLSPSESEGGAGWKITDVLLDGSISQVAVLRSDFYSVLRDGGPAQLVAMLDRRTADLPGDASGRPSGPDPAGAAK